MENGKRNRAIILPFTGKIFPEQCMAIRKYYNLHSQCTNNKPKQKDYCSTCSKNMNDGKPAYGDIRNRLNIGLMDYVDPFGKMTMPFYKVMKRMKVKKEEVLAAAEKKGVVIPDAHWSPPIATTTDTTNTTNQTKTTTDATNTTNQTKTTTDATITNTITNPDQTQITEEVQPEKGKRGRPCKNTVIINECDDVVNDAESTCTVLLFENHEYLLCSSTNEIFDIDTEAKIGMYTNDKIEFC